MLIYFYQKCHRGTRPRVRGTCDTRGMTSCGLFPSCWLGWPDRGIGSDIDEKTCFDADGDWGDGSSDVAARLCGSRVHRRSQWPDRHDGNGGAVIGSDGVPGDIRAGVLETDDILRRLLHGSLPGHLQQMPCPLRSWRHMSRVRSQEAREALTLVGRWSHSLDQGRRSWMYPSTINTVLSIQFTATGTTVDYPLAVVLAITLAVQFPSFRIISPPLVWRTTLHSSQCIRCCHFRYREGECPNSRTSYSTGYVSRFRPLTRH